MYKYINMYMYVACIRDEILFARVIGQEGNDARLIVRIYHYYYYFILLLLLVSWHIFFFFRNCFSFYASILLPYGIKIIYDSTRRSNLIRV